MTTTTFATTADADHADFERLVFKLVWTFQRLHGGDFDELLAEANLHYTSAYASHDPAKGRLAKRIAFQVWWGLYETFRTKARRHSILPQAPMPTDAPARQQFDLRRLLFEVSGDAAEVIRLALDNPLDVLAEANWRGSANKPEHVKTALARFLREIGWTWKRITESFAEIQSVLR